MENATAGRFTTQTRRHCPPQQGQYANKQPYPDTSNHWITHVSENLSGSTIQWATSSDFIKLIPMPQVPLHQRTQFVAQTLRRVTVVVSLPPLLGFRQTATANYGTYDHYAPLPAARAFHALRISLIRGDGGKISLFHAEDSGSDIACAVHLASLAIEQRSDEMNGIFHDVYESDAFAKAGKTLRIDLDVPVLLLDGSEQISIEGTFAPVYQYCQHYDIQLYGVDIDSNSSLTSADGTAAGTIGGYTLGDERAATANTPPNVVRFHTSTGATILPSALTAGDVQVSVELEIQCTPTDGPSNKIFVQQQRIRQVSVYHTNTDVKNVSYPLKGLKHGTLHQVSVLAVNQLVTARNYSMHPTCSGCGMARVQAALGTLFTREQMYTGNPRAFVGVRNNLCPFSNVRPLVFRLPSDYARLHKLGIEGSTGSGVHHFGILEQANVGAKFNNISAISVTMNAQDIGSNPGASIARAVTDAPQSTTFGLCTAKLSSNIFCGPTVDDGELFVNISFDKRLQPSAAILLKTSLDDPATIVESGLGATEMFNAVTAPDPRTIVQDVTVYVIEDSCVVFVQRPDSSDPQQAFTVMACEECKFPLDRSLSATDQAATRAIGHNMAVNGM